MNKDGNGFGAVDAWCKDALRFPKSAVPVYIDNAWIIL